MFRILLCQESAFLQRHDKIAYFDFLGRNRLKQLQNLQRHAHMAIIITTTAGCGLGVGCKSPRLSEKRSQLFSNKHFSKAACSSVILKMLTALEISIVSGSFHMQRPLAEV